MSTSLIPVSRPDVGLQELTAVQQIFDTGWLGHGATVIDFENELSRLLGGRHVLAVSGTFLRHSQSYVEERQRRRRGRDRQLPGVSRPDLGVNKRPTRCMIRRIAHFNQVDYLFTLEDWRSAPSEPR